MFLRDFPEDIRHRLKLQAVKERTTMKEVIIRLTTEYLKKWEKKEEDR
jgi:porphobilinogen deaminase